MPSGVASVIEKAAGLGGPDGRIRTNPYWLSGEPHWTTMRPPKRALRCALGCVPCCRAWAWVVLHIPILESLHDAAVEASLTNEWECAMADIMLDARDFNHLRTFMEKTENAERNLSNAVIGLLRKGDWPSKKNASPTRKLCWMKLHSWGNRPPSTMPKVNLWQQWTSGSKPYHGSKKASQNLNDPVQRTHALIDLGRVLQDLGRTTKVRRPSPRRPPWVVMTHPYWP